MLRRILEFFNPSEHKNPSERKNPPEHENPPERKQPVEMFHELLNGSRCVSRNDFAANFGGIANDVVKMLTSDQAKQAIQEARKTMDNDPVDSRLRKVKFGLFSDAKELERGEVAAIDGTFALPMQKYSAGQAICIGIGSLSHCRLMQDSSHYWSSKAFLSDAADTDDFIAREKRGLFGIYPTAYLRYYEIKHCLKIKEPYLFLDGPLIDESLISTQEGVQLYNKLFGKKNKQVLGIIKNIANPAFTKFARALKSGEIYVIETLADHLNQSNVARSRPVSAEFKNGIACDVFRGVFKPGKKTFGFEVHRDHLEDMLRIMAADCQMNKPGHEIPFLLNRIDEEVRKNFSQHILRDRIATEMAIQSEELFFEETDERFFR